MNKWSQSVAETINKIKNMLCVIFVIIIAVYVFMTPLCFHNKYIVIVLRAYNGIEGAPTEPPKQEKKKIYIQTTS